MRQTLFSYLLAPRHFSPKAQTFGKLIFILAPVALIISIVLVKRSDPNTHLDLKLDRVEAIKTASRHAASLGVNTENWTSAARIVASNDRFFYYRLHRNEEGERARRLAPEVYLNVVFISPDWQQTLNVDLSRDGRLLGYSRKLPSGFEVLDPAEPVARQKAQAAFLALQQNEGFSVSVEPTLNEDRKFNSVSRSYVWRLPFTTLPGLDQRVSITVLGEQILSQKVTTEVDPAYAGKHLVHKQLPARLAILLFGLVVFILACYGLYRYIRRSWQKEVPHARSLLLGAVASCAFIFLALQSEFHVFEPPTETNLTGLYLIILMTTFIFFLMLGMALGLAYGSGEGDLREAYPGKLTSLDALLTGRFFSRNVARAILTGTAFGCWALLARSLVVLPWANRPGSGQGLSQNFWGIFFGHFSWLLPLINPPLGAIQWAVIALLLPLSFLLRRRIRSEKLFIVILSALSLICSFLIFLEQPMPFFALLLVAAVETATLLLLFFMFDVLTAIVGLATPALVISILYFVSQPPVSLQRSGYLATGIALAFFGIAFFFLFRGREYSEDEVRPLYARYLAERLRLEAEVSAAREAQVRLLPQKLPEVSHLSLAAACRPARVVGGDFYDLFVLDEKRLGIFVAEGGGYGLGAALTIAFAKGFLMPKIASGLTPAEILGDLLNQLAPMLEKEQQLHLAYAVINTSDQTLSYARVGRYPQVKICRNGDSHQNDGREEKPTRHQPALPQEEQEVHISSLAETPSNISMREATVQLAPGDVVILVTDGILKNLEAERKVAIEDWASDVVSQHTGDSRRPLQEALHEALEKRAKLSKKFGIDDDLTAVLIRLEAAGNTKQ